MKTVAVITARGGSKRIPRKNIKEFCGKPILAYSIEAALASGCFDTVMVSTDDAEIAEIARQYGAEVPFYRSEDTANDFATTAEVLREVLAEYEKRGEHFDRLCCIYPTAPFLTAQKLKAAEALLEERDADSVVSVVRYGFPPQRSVVLEEGYLKFKWPEHALTRSQDLEPFYHDAGQILEKALQDEKTADLEYHVVSGVFNQNLPSLLMMEKLHSNVHIHQKVTEMAELMQSCDAAITAGGSTMYELCAVGVPILCFSFVDNQEQIVKTFLQEDYVCFGGDYLTQGQALFDGIVEQLGVLRDEKSRRLRYSKKERQLVDGCGAMRIAKALCRLGSRKGNGQEDRNRQGKEQRSLQK